MSRKLPNGARTETGLSKYSTMDFLEICEDNLGTLLKGLDGHLYYLKADELSRKCILKNMREGAALYVNPEGYWSSSEAEAHRGRIGKWFTGREGSEIARRYADDKAKYPLVYSALFWSHVDSKRVLYLEGYSLEPLLRLDLEERK